MTPTEIAQKFVETHAKLREIAEFLQPWESEYLSDNGLGSAGMQASGVYDEYMMRSGQRGELVKELTAIRKDMGNEALLAELAKLPEADLAKTYVERMVSHEQRIPSEAAQELKPKKKSWFKFR